MLRNIFYMQFFLLVLLSFKASGTGRDSSALFRQQKILIIPYEPRMHISDADMDISEYSDKTPQQVRAIFRMGISEKLNASLSSTYETHSLLQDLRPEAIEDMDRIYASIDYSFDTSYAILHPRPDSASTTGWNEKKARKKELEQRTLNGKVIYTNVKILDPRLLSSLQSKYGVDLFVFMTQAEIKTNAKDCIDFQSGIYQRDIMIHYAVFDYTGKQLYGDVASIKFPSNSNDIGDIMAQNFPALSEKIKKNIAQK